MKFDSWLHQVSMLSDTEMAVLAESAQELRALWQGDINPVEAVRRLKQGRSRLKKTFPAGDGISLDELANVLCVEPSRLLAASVDRTVIAGAVPPKSYASGLVGRERYYLVEEVHRVYGDLVS